MARGVLKTTSITREPSSNDADTGITTFDIAVSVSTVSAGQARVVVVKFLCIVCVHCLFIP